MKQRSKRPGHASKLQGRKPVSTVPKRSSAKASKIKLRSDGSSPARQSDLTQLQCELHEALEQQAAVSEVLSTISSSSGELEPVFRTILENAARICHAQFGTLNLYNAGTFHTAALHNPPPQFAQRLGAIIHPHPKSGLAHVARTKQIAHIDDIRTHQPYLDGHKAVVDLADLAGARTLLIVPMLNEGRLIGAISIYRQEVRLFAERQIGLLRNFAAQAVIAIENARLLSELRQRTADLSELLEQQTATSEVLKVISRAPGELDAVFQAVLSNATRICEAAYGNLLLRENGAFRRAAQCNAPQELIDEFQRTPVFVPLPNNPLDRVLKTKETVHTADARAESNLGLLADARTLLNVPMLSHDELIGAISIYRREVRPFTEKQINLVQNFAAQAVIAIENARLLTELRESLQQQTATSEVLSVISSSPGKLQPVFQAVLQNAVHICQASLGNLWLREGDRFRIVAIHGASKEYRNYLFAEPLVEPDAGSAMGRIASTASVVQIEDISNTPTHGMRMRIATIEIAKARTLIGVPMLKDNEVVGIIAVYRQEVRRFNDQQVELLQNFAAQAVIAIENARLLNELRESLQQQTATSEVLGVISSSPGELERVFQAMLENAIRICEAKFGNLFRFDGEHFHFGAEIGAPAKLVEFQRRQGPFQPVPGGGLDRMLCTKQAVHLEDHAAEASVTPSATLGGARSTLWVPMLKEDQLIGAITIYRQEVRPFTDKQIDLVKNFAAQAVIAIENARLLKELRERTAQLEARSQEIAKLNKELEARVADQVGEIERMSRLRRFLPPQVADLIVASGTERQLESHRREITALFCDLRGFTGFSESSDPEDVMLVLRQYHEAIGTIIIKYSGTLERYAGDGVMVVFNDPVPVENPALQAVRMALEMRGALGALIERWRRLGHDLGFGIGIAHGYATLGTIGFEGRFDYAAIGTVSNVASRLCDEAKPGQILISPRVLMAVEEAVAVEPVGNFALKGISRPMAAYNVVGLK